VRSADIDGRSYWSAGSVDETASRSNAPRAHLLQAYDEYIIAYRESRDVLDVGGLAGSVPSGTTTYTHALLLNGQVVGHWRRTNDAKSMTIDVQLARRLTAREREAVDVAVARYGRFVGLPTGWVRSASGR
jgi:hypothetical protein